MKSSSSMPRTPYRARNRGPCCGEGADMERLHHRLGIRRPDCPNLRRARESRAVAIGRDSNTAIFEHDLQLEAIGYIVWPDGVHANVRGAFAAGDVNGIRYKQAITAAGAGCRASLEAERYLEEVDAERLRLIPR